MEPGRRNSNDRHRSPTGRPESRESPSSTMLGHRDLEGAGHGVLCKPPRRPSRAPNLDRRAIAALLGLVPVAGEVLRRIDHDRPAAAPDAPERIVDGIDEATGVP